MTAMQSPTQTESSKGSLPVKPVEVLIAGPDDLNSDRFPSERPSLGKRVPLAVARFLITFCFGLAATLAWQSYGDRAREMIANSSPQLRWLAPQPAPAMQNAPEVTAPTALAASPPDQQQLDSPDQQQLNAISLNLDAVRQSLDRIGTSQEQLMRTVDQVAAGQDQMTREISKLQATGQYMLYKNSEPPPPQASAPVTTRRSLRAPTTR